MEYGIAKEYTKPQKDDMPLCPMSFASGKPFKCVGMNCRWWQVYHKDTDQEYGECVVESLSCLQDMAGYH